MRLSRKNGWAFLAETMERLQPTPLERMVALGVRLQKNQAVPVGKVFVVNPETLYQIPTSRFEPDPFYELNDLGVRFTGGAMFRRRPGDVS